MKSLYEDITARMDLRSPSLLRFALLLAIVAATAPDALAAMELRLLLELLGATLFVTACFSALRLLIERAAVTARDALLPAGAVAMLRESSRWRERGAAAGLIFFHAIWWVAFAIAVFAWGNWVTTKLA